MWIVIMDNLKGRFPEGFFLNALNNFLKFIEETTDVEAFILSEEKIISVKIEAHRELKILEKNPSDALTDGVVVSFTRSAVEKIINNEDLRIEFLNILKRLKKMPH
ncbi:hypothetical protein LCGC14_1096220 [marine sediment metagenome]|uniref:Uncharacterized protein n=1 Tax=marine sediment metagenome TaxID=412755 RepID=A0A0F9MYL9_9ZZZZ